MKQLVKSTFAIIQAIRLKHGHYRDINFRNWAEVCSNRFTYADDDGVIAGFRELEFNGHIDCFYCHRNYQRCGVGSQIYQAIEAKAFDLGMSYHNTEESQAK